MGSDISNLTRGIGNKVVDESESGKRMTLLKKLVAENYNKKDIVKIKSVTSTIKHSPKHRDQVLDTTLKCNCEYLKSLGAENPKCVKCFLDDIAKKNASVPSYRKKERTTK